MQHLYKPVITTTMQHEYFELKQAINPYNDAKNKKALSDVNSAKLAELRLERNAMLLPIDLEGYRTFKQGIDFVYASYLTYEINELSGFNLLPQSGITLLYEPRILKAEFLVLAIDSTINEDEDIKFNCVNESISNEKIYSIDINYDSWFGSEHTSIDQIANTTEHILRNDNITLLDDSPLSLTVDIKLATHRDAQLTHCIALAASYNVPTIKVKSMHTGEMKSIKFKYNELSYWVSNVTDAEELDLFIDDSCRCNPHVDQPAFINITCRINAKTLYRLGLLRPIDCWNNEDYALLKNIAITSLTECLDSGLDYQADYEARVLTKKNGSASNDDYLNTFKEFAGEGCSFRSLFKYFQIVLDGDSKAAMRSLNKLKHLLKNDDLSRFYQKNSVGDFINILHAYIESND